jgi:hypothetical protein
MFSPGEFEAARVYVACLTRHALQETFKADSIGFEFTEEADMAAGVTEDGVPVTGKDFIRSALKIMLGQLASLSILTGMDIPTLIETLGIAVATDDPRLIDL